MFDVENATIIPAPPSRVWATITRFDGYARWNPFVRIAGIPTAGNTVGYSYRLSAGAARFHTIDARIVASDSCERFVVQFGSRFLLNIEETYELSSHPSGSYLRHAVRCSGPITMLPIKKMSRLFSKIIATIDSLLKHHLMAPTGNVLSAPKCGDLSLIGAIILFLECSWSSFDRFSVVEPYQV